MTCPTTYVLVHGAWHDGQSWNRVAPLLTAQGHRVFTPSLTGHGDKAHLLSPEVGLTTHTDDIVSLVLDHDLNDIVLVGHSYAGMVISSVANQIPERISRLLYLDAMVPTHGENAIDVMPLTQVMIDSAADNAEPWRIPPLPEFPRRTASSESPTPTTSPGSRPHWQMSRPSASSSQPRWTTPHRRPSPELTFSAPAMSPRASHAGPSRNFSPTGSRLASTRWTPATTPWLPSPRNSAPCCSKTPDLRSKARPDILSSPLHS